MTRAQVRRGARDAAAVAVHPDGRERARRAREVMRSVAASRPVADHGGETNSYDLARRLPNATLRIYRDAGHGSIFQYHEQFVREALEFLGS